MGITELDPLVFWRRETRNKRGSLSAIAERLSFVSSTSATESAICFRNSETADSSSPESIFFSTCNSVLRRIFTRLGFDISTPGTLQERTTRVGFYLNGPHSTMLAQRDVLLSKDVPCASSSLYLDKAQATFSVECATNK
jgi:hypothetical protein